MRVVCRHGFSAYYPSEAGDVKRFTRLFGVKLFPEADYLTYEGLLGLPRFSIAGIPYAGGLPATKTIEGRHAAEVMRANKLVYSLALEALVPVVSVISTLTIPMSLDYALSPGPFVAAGATLQNARRLISYEGMLDLTRQRLLIYDMEFLL